jgi:hypothetical protein
MGREIAKLVTPHSRARHEDEHAAEARWEWGVIDAVTPCPAQPVCNLAGMALCPNHDMTQGPTNGEGAASANQSISSPGRMHAWSVHADLGELLDPQRDIAA